MNNNKNRYIKYFESKIKESNIDNENISSLNIKHAVVHAKCSFNNTLFTVTDLNGNEIKRAAAGGWTKEQVLNWFNS